MADIADATQLDSAMYATWLAAMRFEDPRAIYAVVLGDSVPARAALARLPGSCRFVPDVKGDGRATQRTRP